jgi:two-component system, NtrC family, sensor histidine kinase AtoS
MKSFSSQLAANLLGKKEPGLNEVYALINLDEEPCALIDNRAGCLLFLNSRLVKLSAFTSAELNEKPIGFLFNDLDLRTVTSGESRPVNLCRKGQSFLELKARFDFIDQEARWLRVRINSAKSVDSQSELQIDNLVDRLVAFTSQIEVLDSAAEISKTMEIIKEILGVESVCLYQASPDFPVLRKTGSSLLSTYFPDEIPSTDLIRLREPNLWKPGSRVFTEIHRYARVNEIEYVATAALKQDEAAIGLLAVCGKGQVKEELRLSVLQLLTSWIMALIQKATLIENLNKEILHQNARINQLKALTENLQEGIVLLKPDLSVAEINPAAEWMLGYAEWEVKGQPYDNILIGVDRLLPTLEDAKKGNTTPNIGKANLNRRNGQSFPVHMQVIPVFLEKELTWIQVLITDISENEQSKALTAQLEHRAVLGDYTAAFAHDVRNPINNIFTGIQLIGANLPADDPNQETIGRVQNDCTRLNHLMESFLAFSRPLELKFESIEIGNYLQRIVDRWRPRLARVNVTPKVTIDGENLKVLGDPRSLDQVFTNLISNSLDAMTDTGDTLAIRIIPNHEIANHPSIEISVSDNGPGIPEDIKDHIFEPFVTTRQKGTGLGLAITKQIVTAHKGSISVNSFPGGTVFTVRLPADIGE